MHKFQQRFIYFPARKQQAAQKVPHGAGVIYFLMLSPKLTLKFKKKMQLCLRERSQVQDSASRLE